MENGPVELLKRLVAIPSVSPMRPDLPASIVGEARLTVFLENTLTEMGLRVRRQSVWPGRDNLIAQLDGETAPGGGGRVILFDAHQDTVPVDGMTIEPFNPIERDGRIFGRGACDTKGGMAAAIAAVARLVRERPKTLPTIVLSFTVDEENGFGGAKQLSRQWIESDSSPICPRPDAAIVLEPTGLDVVVAHKGVVRWKTHVFGRAAHSSTPRSGENAIYGMAQIVAGIERYADKLAGGEAHPLCGSATASVGTIHGGAGVNTVPDSCTIEIDYRPLPGEDMDAARRRFLDNIMLGVPGVQVEHETPFLHGPSLANEGNGPLAERLRGIVSEIHGGCREIGASCCTNAPFFAAADVPVVVFGPGFLKDAHTADESIAVEQLEQASEAIYRFCRNFGQ